MKKFPLFEYYTFRFPNNSPDKLSVYVLGWFCIALFGLCIALWDVPAAILGCSFSGFDPDRSHASGEFPDVPVEKSAFRSLFASWAQSGVPSEHRFCSPLLAECRLALSCWLRHQRTSGIPAAWILLLSLAEKSSHQRFFESTP